VSKKSYKVKIFIFALRLDFGYASKPKLNAFDAGISSQGITVQLNTEKQIILGQKISFLQNNCPTKAKNRQYWLTIFFLKTPNMFLRLILPFSIRIRKKFYFFKIL
jgi:hypothetical protein